MCLLLLPTIPDFRYRSQKETVEYFANHWFRGEFEEVKPYTTPESELYIDWMKEIKTDIDLESLKETEVAVKIFNTKALNDSIQICQCHISIDNQVEDMDFYLKKNARKWYVNIVN
jgi:diacylglycerol kinase family enzyme